jgi:anti-sigma B factor antagonist
MAEGVSIMTLELSVCLREGHAMAAARGELGVTSLAGAMSAIAALTARHEVVIVELSAVEFMDCGALGALLRVQRLARQSGGDVLLATPVPMMLRVLSLTGVDAVFGVHASADAAVTSIAGSRVAGASRRAERAGCPVAGTPALSGSSR